MPIKKISHVQYKQDKGPTIILCVPGVVETYTSEELINYCKSIDSKWLVYKLHSTDKCRCPDEKQIYQMNHLHVTIKGRHGSYDEVSKTLSEYLQSLPLGELVEIELETRNKEGQENLNRGAHDEITRRGALGSKKEGES